jgi:hypothetical protein
MNFGIFRIVREPGTAATRFAAAKQRGWPLIVAQEKKVGSKISHPNGTSATSRKPKTPPTSPTWRLRRSAKPVTREGLADREVGNDRRTSSRALTRVGLDTFKLVSALPAAFEPQ